MHYASVQSVQLSVHKIFTVVKTKIELDSHADTFVVGDLCIVICDHNRAVDIFRFDPKAGSKHDPVVDAKQTQEY